MVMTSSFADCFAIDLTRSATSSNRYTPRLYHIQGLTREVLDCWYKHV